MDRQKQDTIHGVYRILLSLIGEFAFVFMEGKISSVRLREWKETLRSLADRLERVTPDE